MSMVVTEGVPGAARAPLRLAPGCTILSDAGALYVLTRRGSFDLRAAGIDQLHGRLRSFLNGTHTANDLLAAVGPRMAGTVETYLRRLRDIGAFVEDGEEGAEADAVHAAAEALGPARPALAIRVGRLRVAVSLNGSLPLRSGTRTLCFTTASEAARILGTLRRSETLRGRWTCVVVDRTPGTVPAAELERRAAIARWLLRTELNVLRDLPRVQAYTSGTEGTLSLSVSAEREQLPTIPRQLGLVRPAPVDQLPLVVAEASHPWFSAVLRGCGLDYPAVEGRLLRRFLAQLLAGTRPGQRGGFRAGAIGAPLRERQRSGTRPSPSAWAMMAPSLASLDLALLEAWADARAERAPLRWREVDLLTESAGHPVLEHLRDVLLLRMARLPARLAVSPEGLVLCQAGGRRTRSLIREKAIAEMLLGATWDEYYAGGWTGAAPELACEAATFATEAEIRELVRKRRSARPPHAIVGKVQCWGTSFWMGRLEEGR